MAKKIAPHMLRVSPSGKEKKEFHASVYHYGKVGNDSWDHGSARSMSNTTHKGFFSSKKEAQSHFESKFPNAHSVNVREAPKRHGIDPSRRKGGI